MATKEPLTVSWAGATHVGRVRSKNEDAVFPNSPGTGAPPLTFAVADGLGGEPAGDVASRIAIEAVAEVAGKPMMAEAVVLAAETRLHEHITAHLDERLELTRMATTLTAAADLDHIGGVGGRQFEARISVCGADDEEPYPSKSSTRSTSMSLSRGMYIDGTEYAASPGTPSSSRWSQAPSNPAL